MELNSDAQLDKATDSIVANSKQLTKLIFAMYHNNAAMAIVTAGQVVAQVLAVISSGKTPQEQEHDYNLACEQIGENFNAYCRDIEEAFKLKHGNETKG